jgi:hypothetical protein
MKPEALTEDLRRLIFSIPSIPHLEAILLMRRSGDTWQPAQLAQRLYLSTERTAGILADLAAARICRVEGDADPADPAYRYAPYTTGLDMLVASLARYYSQNLIEVTNMIHASLRRHSRIQEFADAFKWDKKKP